MEREEVHEWVPGNVILRAKMPEDVRCRAKYQKFSGNGTAHAPYRYGWVIDPAWTSQQDKEWLRQNGFKSFGGKWCREDV